MDKLVKEYRVGTEYLETATTLLNRIRCSHPTAGLYEAAELQWWWAQNPRRTDDLEQLFWFDQSGRPAAAAIVTDFGTDTQLAPLVLPQSTPDWIAHVMRDGLDHASESGYEAVMLEVDRVDHGLRSVLDGHGFTVQEDELVESWLDPHARPPISALPVGYELVDRTVNGRPHHMIHERRKHFNPEPRLRQSSLYNRDLDLAVYDNKGDVAGYGLFWNNPATGVGIVEPMRVEADHQKRGLARHLLTCGIERLADAGAKRIKVCFDPNNAAAKHLYLSTGFEPDRENDIFAGPTSVDPG